MATLTSPPALPAGKTLNLHLAADLLLVAVTLFWGTSFALVKEVLAQTSVPNLLFLRFGLATVLLLPVAWWRRASFDREVIVPGLICGFFLFAAFMSQAVGLQYTAATRSGFITGLSVVLVPLFSVAILRRPPTLFAALGAATAFGGLYLLTLADQAPGAAFNRGDAWTLGCAFFCAGHILGVGLFAPRRNAFWLAFIQFLAITLGSAVWAAGAGELTFSVSREVIGVAAFLAAGCSILAFWGQAWAQKYTTPTRTAVIFTLEPVFAAIFSRFYLDERLGPAGLLGGGLILVGLLLAEVKPKAWTAGRT